MKGDEWAEAFGFSGIIPIQRLSGSDCVQGDPQYLLDGDPTPGSWMHT